MLEQRLVVGLGERRYRIERPWEDLSGIAGRVSDVAVDSRGHVFVLLRNDPLVDPPRDAVVELNPEGTRVGSWGANLIADSHMLRCTEDGRIFVVDRDAHEVVICSQKGERLGGIGRRHAPLAPFNHPTCVAFSPCGDIYVSDGYANCRIHCFDSQGIPRRSWGRHGSDNGAFLNPHAVWVCSDGAVAVVDRGNNRIQLFSGSGEWLVSWHGFSQPLGIWGDASDNIFVTDLTPSLTMLRRNGDVVGRCRPVLNGAHGICGDKAGNLYLAEGNPSRVARLVPFE
ncbi:MAG: hypothetical protein AB7K64_00055 [Variibacter sp.]